MNERVTREAGSDAEAIEMLREAEPAFTLAFLRAFPDAVLLLNAAGRVGFINDRGRTLLGIAATQDLTGRNWWELWEQGAHEALRAGFDRALNGPLVKLRARRPDDPVPWEITLSPIVNLGGKTESVLMVARPAGSAPITG